MASTESPTKPSLLHPSEVADRLGCSIHTLKSWRRAERQMGPSFVRIGGRIRYPAAAVDAYVAAGEQAA